MRSQGAIRATAKSASEKPPAFGITGIAGPVKQSFIARTISLSHSADKKIRKLQKVLKPCFVFRKPLKPKHVAIPICEHEFRVSCSVARQGHEAQITSLL